MCVCVCVCVCVCSYANNYPLCMSPRCVIMIAAALLVSRENTLTRGGATLRKGRNRMGREGKKMGEEMPQGKDGERQERI